MFKNNFKIAVRNLLKYKFYSFLNLTGLAIGVATCLLILLFVQDELNYDRYNDKADRIYRVIADFKLGGNTLLSPHLGSPTAEALLNDYPEVENFVRIRSTGNWFIKYGETTFKETRLIRADSTFFEFFSVPLIMGNPKTALNKPNAITLSESMKNKYFGSENPLGKVLRLDDREDYIVTGVYKDIPYSSHFHPDFITMLKFEDNGINQYWLGNMSYYTYILLQKNYNYKNLEAKFPAMVQKYIGPEILMFVGKTMEEFFKEGNKAGYFLQPLTDIHLYSDYQGEIEPGGDIKYVYIFSAIAAFILFIACINFMNLATARAAGRAKEVGIKKVLGSDRKELVKQFLTESIIMSLISTFLAVILMQILLPYFNNLSGKQLEVSYLTNVQFLIALLVLTVFIGILAGSYPALFISAFKPVSVLKGKLRSGAKSGFLRSSMVVFQFCSSIIMIIATTVVFNQLQFIQNKKIGFSKENVIILHDTYILGDQITSFKNEIETNPNIVSGTISNYLPVESNRNMNGTFRDGRIDDEKLTPMQSWRIDYNYLKTMGMELVEGRDFSEEFGSDSSAVIINEATAEHFEWKKPLGKRLSQFASSNGSKIATYTVIGVVKNFHYESLKNTIGPVLMYLRPSTSSVAFRYKGVNTKEVIGIVKDKWNKFAPGQPLEYSFMDEDFNKMYAAEQKIGEIFSIFAFLTIFVACLGLFGLAAFTAEQRTKEIGIRKVLGASVLGIILMISKEFAKLVLIAFIISVPIAYYYMNIWLQDFQYRIDLSAGIFLFAGFSALLIAMITVSYHAVRIATSNPSKSLRYE
ncbi:MAG: ABC transporter permease [Bacteroidetes bacterium]|nr:ABC transporter permease [Bacteroidota bacterium]